MSTGLLMAVALVGCSVGGTNTGTTTANCRAAELYIPPGGSIKPFKDGDTPDLRQRITTGATYDNTIIWTE